MHTKRFYIHTLGCRVNQAQSDEIAVKLSDAGWAQTDTLNDADICIVNTCTVTGEADKKSRKTVRSLMRRNNADVYVCGCSVAINSEVYSKIGAKVSLNELGLSNTSEQIKHNQNLEKGESKASEEWANAEKCESEVSELQSKAEKEESKATEQQSNTEKGKNKAAGQQAKTLKNTKASEQQAKTTQNNNSQSSTLRLHARRGIVIQNGCNNACTYCIVHTARGPARSKPACEILAECMALAKDGVHEIILTGIDLGAWKGLTTYYPVTISSKIGIDLGAWKGSTTPASHSNPQTLSMLLKLLLANTPDDLRFRLSSIEPTSIDEQLIDMLAKSDGRLCRYLHIPLQSGSTKILQEMHRHYTAKEYSNLIETLQKACPEIAISTDIIVGFPGETEQDFQETYELAKQAKFMKLHIFPYSMREGTPAAQRTDQIDPQTKADRAKRLKKLNDELYARDLANRYGSLEGVIIETKTEQITSENAYLCTGTTESFHTIKFISKEKEGSLVNAVIQPSI